jgi:hypothetical protein
LKNGHFFTEPPSIGQGHDSNTFILPIPIHGVV